MPDANTKLLLHFNGEDESQVVIDSSASEHEITCVNTAQLDTAQKVLGTASGLLDGNSDYFSAANHADWDFGTGNLTIETYVRFAVDPSGFKVGFFDRYLNGDNDFRWYLHSDGNLYFLVIVGGDTKANYHVAWNPAADTDYHIALVRSGTTIYMFIEGVKQTLTVTTAVGANNLNVAAGITLGYYVDGPGYVNGWLDELRISNVARWTDTFDPPTEEYGTYSDTVTESASAADAQDATGIYSSAVTESASATDAQDATGIYSSAITESASASDSTNSGWLFSSTITESAIAAEVQDAYKVYTEIPPFMHKDLIDPYSGGAWLWLCEVAVPGYDTQNIARNTAKVNHRGKDYTRHNVRIGTQPFAGDGSIPRIMLQVGQDPDRVIEEIVNASEGCYNGTVKLIRVNEKFLDYEVKALEADYGMLVAESDWEWVTFTLGIPNPLTQRIPLRIGSSKICPWAIPELFKDAECQYAGALTSCTGTIEDCRDNKDNAVHWGGELGLDPNATRI